MISQSPLLRPGRTCWAVSPVDEGGVIIDTKAYYRAVHRAITRARRYVLMLGWQFDTDVALVRGQEAQHADAPAELLPLLETVCRRRPELEVYLLTWNFSPVYLRERQLLQKYRFTWRTSPRIRFEWDRWLRKGASMHQKLVVVDGAVAFAGGMDVCGGRWDGRDHRTENPLRRSRSGDLDKPYHDIQAFVRGPAVRDLERLFCERWRRNTGEMLELPELVFRPVTLAELTDGEALPIRARQVGLSRTSLPPSDDPAPAAREIRALYVDAIASAERLIYMENQYFTSRTLTHALIIRLAQRDRPRIQLVLLMPKGGDSPKEKLALGDAQASALATVKHVAQQHGHDFKLLYPANLDARGLPQATFIHSKLLIVDDRLLSVGSANATNRSLGLDSELNLSWESDSAETTTDIAHVRASLLGEHCGRSDSERYLEIDGLSERLDAACSAGARLRAIALAPVDDADPLLSLATDPEGPLRAETIGDRLEEIWESPNVGVFKSGIAWVGSRLARKRSRAKRQRRSSA